MTYSTALYDGMPLDYILDVETYCNGFREERGESRADHASPDDYPLDDLAAMYEYAACPLHIDPIYPTAPEGVWKRQVAEAIDELGRLTEVHADARAPNRSQLRHFRATPGELRAVWDRFPHARWFFDRQTAAGGLTIKVV